MKPRIWVLPVLVILLLQGLWVLPLGAEDVGVLIDISGSLRPLKPGEARETLANLIVEGRINGNWDSYSPSDAETGRSLKEGTHGPLIKEGDRFLFMTFGDRTTHYPFFASPKIYTIQAPKEVRQWIKKLYPETYIDSHTYWELALAVSCKQFREEKRTKWYLLIVSDFDTDYEKGQRPPLTKEQEALQNDFEARGTFEQRVILTLTHKSPLEKLKIKLYEVSLKQKGPDITDVPPGKEIEKPSKNPRIISPTGSIDNPRPVFQWEPAEGANRYVIKGFLGPEMVFNEETPAPNTTYQASQDLKPGEYDWVVVAYKQDQQLGSDKANFTLNISWTILGLITVLGVIAAVLGGVGLFFYHERFMAWVRDFFKGFRGE